MAGGRIVYYDMYEELLARCSGPMFLFLKEKV